jgi:hypothetical protein
MTIKIPTYLGPALELDRPELRTEADTCAFISKRTGVPIAQIAAARANRTRRNTAPGNADQMRAKVAAALNQPRTQQRTQPRRASAPAPRVVNLDEARAKRMMKDLAK